MGGIGAGTVGVDPSVDFQAAGFGLGNKVGEGVVAGIGALRACEVAAPGLEAGRVEGVGLGSDLEHHGVEAGGFRGVEQAVGLLFLDLDGQALLGGKVDVVDGGNPGALEVGAGLGGEGEKGGEDGQESFHGFNKQRIRGAVRFR